MHINISIGSTIIIVIIIVAIITARTVIVFVVVMVSVRSMLAQAGSVAAAPGGTHLIIEGPLAFDLPLGGLQRPPSTEGHLPLWTTSTSTCPLRRLRAPWRADSRCSHDVNPSNRPFWRWRGASGASAAPCRQDTIVLGTAATDTLPGDGKWIVKQNGGGDTSNKKAICCYDESGGGR